MVKSISKGRDQKWFTSFMLLLACCLAVSGCIIDNVKENIRVGDTLPEFEVSMSDGSVVNGRSLSGNVSVVMFFHTSCPDCQKTLPVMQDIYDEYALNGVVFALVSREESEDYIRAFWALNGLEMPFSAQEDKDIYSMFASSGIPRIYISDKNRTVRYVFTDDPVPSYDELRNALEDVIR